MIENEEEYAASLQRVKESLKDYSELEVKILPNSTHTAELAAQALGTTPGQIAKTLCFLADEEPILVVACGDKKIDTKKVRNISGAKKIKMADAQTVMQVTGFAPGGVCPFALRQKTAIYLDNSLKEYDVTFIAAGTPHSALPISAETLEQVTAGTWVDATK